MNDLKIKLIEDVHDFDDIMTIEVEAFKEPYTKDLYLFDYTEHPYSEYYKLLLKDELIGYVGLWILYEYAQITTIAISPNYQRKGYGAYLMDFVMKLVKDYHCQNITLEVRVSNKKAIELYKKYHFEIVAKRKQYYENGEDAFLMKCDLDH